MKKLWLDLEMTGDIDDAICLIFALEHNLNVKAVSLLNPSKEELSFTRYWLDYFNQDIALFTHYEKSIKNINKAHNVSFRFCGLLLALVLCSCLVCTNNAPNRVAFRHRTPI